MVPARCVADSEEGRLHPAHHVADEPPNPSGRWWCRSPGDFGLQGCHRHAHVVVAVPCTDEVVVRDQQTDLRKRHAQALGRVLLTHPLVIGHTVPSRLLLHGLKARRRGSVCSTAKKAGSSRSEPALRALVSQFFDSTLGQCVDGRS